MEFKEYLKVYNTQEKIDKLAKKYKNKRIVLYGAGQFSQCIFENYDLSKLNIVGVADKIFEDDKTHEFYNLNCIKPADLRTMDYDVILITNFDTKHFLNILDEAILYGSKNAGVEVRAFIKLTFKDIFLTKNKMK